MSLRLVAKAPKPPILFLPPLPSIRDLLKLYKLRAKRQLSQNFLLDQRLCGRIVAASGKMVDGYVCEIGPGPGNITRQILHRNPKKVLVIEKDPRFLPMLESLSEACNNRLEVNLGDCLSYNLEGKFPEEAKREWDDNELPNIHIVGNLPFSVATHLIIRYLHAMYERRNAWAYGRVRLTLTFQKEVAQRMVSPVMGDCRCRLSVMCQAFAHVHYKFNLPGRCFTPPPDVDVGVVHIVPRIEPLVQQPFTLFEKVVRTIFNRRRKYCYKAAAKLFPTPGQQKLTNQLFTMACVNPQTYPTHLTVEEYSRLSDSYSEICTEYPGIDEYDFRAPRNKRFMFEKDFAGRHGIEYNLGEKASSADEEDEGEEDDSLPER